MEFIEAPAWFFGQSRLSRVRGAADPNRLEVGTAVPTDLSAATG